MMCAMPIPARNRQPGRSRLPLWVAFGVALLLIAWWEWGNLQRNAPEPKPLLTSQVGTTPANLPPGAEVAILAGGCFWCTEADFDKVPGVLDTTSGFTGGKTANPSYAEVSSHTTGHAEAVRVVFDPKRVSYEQLLSVFWRSIDPTTRDRQFCDIGSPYRTAIFATSALQLQQAQASLAELQASKPFADPILTQIQMAEDFYPAEPEHQDFHRVNPIRYELYRLNCGRDARLAQLWGQAKGP
jgi:peptide-methionine (S)-S-oxide reductase